MAGVANQVPGDQEDSSHCVSNLTADPISACDPFHKRQETKDDCWVIVCVLCLQRLQLSEWSVEMNTEIMGFIMGQDIVVRMDDGHYDGQLQRLFIELQSGI